MAKRYAAGVRAADAALGKLLAEVRRQLHDPVVAVVADHGEALDEHLDARGYAYDHGEFLDDAEIRIALVLAGPGVAAGRSGTAVSIRDLYTTLLAVAGIEDADASAADRRDLRQPVAEPRTARIERRIVAPLELANFGPAARARIETHAVAASDGGRTVIVGEDGSLTTRPQPEAPELVAAARGYLRAVRGEPDVAGSEALDPALREALESLGYVRE